MRILVVEDDEILQDGLRMGLTIAGFTVDAVETCEDADNAVLANEYDAVVLDLMLPDGSGLDVLQRIRRAGRTTPVLLLTARDGVRDRIAGLDGGADDYLGKPFDLGEVSARLRALTRRGAGEARAVIERDGLRLDPATLSVSCRGEPVRLSRREFVVLQALMLHPGAVLSRSRLEDKLYGWQEEVESNAVEVHIHKLRAKLGAQIIRTVRGVGYSFGEVPL